MRWGGNYELGMSWKQTIFYFLKEFPTYFSGESVEDHEDYVVGHRVEIGIQYLIWLSQM
jgi:hypothetical protein